MAQETGRAFVKGREVSLPWDDSEGDFLAGMENYSGDDTAIKDMWPFERVHYTEHSHWAPCGGEFSHSHQGGRTPHAHSHEPCIWCPVGIRP